MSEAKINIPADWAPTFRRAVLGELSADCAELDFGSGDPDKPTLDHYQALIDTHRATLDAIGWDDADNRDTTLAAEAGYLRKMLESAMSSVSDDIAGAVGEYRKDGITIRTAEVYSQAAQLEWLLEATDCLDARVADAEKVGAA